MAILLLLNNFLHDFSAAGWLFGGVVLWAILRKKIPDGDSGRIIIDTIKTVLILMRLSLAGIIIFGVFRALAYKNFEWNEQAGDSQVTLLIVKHAVLTVIFVLGLVYNIRARKIVRKATVEKIE